MNAIPEGAVDTHVHYWDPSVIPYAWLDTLPTLNRPFLPSDHAAVSGGSKVSKILFVESGCDASHSLKEVDWIVSLAHREPRIRGIVAHASLELGEGVRNHLQRLAERPLVKGVRRLLQSEQEKGFCLRPGFTEGVRMLGEFGFTMDLCIRHQQLSEVTRLASAVPEVTFILDHFGKPPVKSGALEPWRSSIRDLAALPNVVCKVSGLTTEADMERWTPGDLKPYFDAVMESFGTSRLLFGGDWPVCTLATEYQRWVKTVSELTSSLSMEDSAKLFRFNAERIYRI